jgi:thiol-disulfide isomerase/thioredoxin
MKKSLLFSTALLLAGSLSAQMPDGSICPDFTGTDLNGNTHNLYSYLDQGYTVIVDVSATWCGPCWSYHNTHALSNLYTQYGPGTAEDRVMVLFIEGDAATTVAHLNGASGSQGNWVTGTPYPIINDHTIAQLLQISYFPTVYKICPNRVITEVGQGTTAALWTAAQNCQMATHPNDPALLPAVSYPSTCVGNSIPLTVRLQNMGLENLTSATIQARQGANVIGSTDWTGNLGTYALQDVTVTNYTPAAGNNAITFEITSPDNQANNNTATGTIVAGNTVMPGVNVTLELKTDNYASETTWKLFNPNGTVFAQDPAGNYANNTVYTYNWNLQNESCYTFEIYDSYGDGICCQYGQGYYKLMVNGVVVLQGGSFTSMEAKPFRTSIFASVNEMDLSTGLNVYPNPANGLVTVELDNITGSTAAVRVFDMLGSLVHTVAGIGNGSQRINLDLTHLPSGVYHLELSAADLRATRKITIAH